MLKLYAFILFFACPLYAQQTTPPLIVYGETFLHNTNWLEKDKNKSPELFFLQQQQTLYSGTSTQPKFFIFRGIGEKDQFQLTPKYSVSTFLNDINLTGFYFRPFFFTLESTKTLKSPQNIKYGGQSLGGHIQYNFLTPEDPISFLELASYNSLQIGHAQSFELSPSTVLSLAIQKNSQEGFFFNNYLKERTNKRDSLSGLLGFSYQDSFLTITSDHLISLYSSGYDTWNVKNSYKTLSDKPGQDNQNSSGHSLKVNLKTRKTTTLTSKTSWTSGYGKTSFDSDWNNNAFWNSQGTTYDYTQTTEKKRSLFSQELLWTETLHPKLKLNTALTGDLILENNNESTFANGTISQRVGEYRSQQWGVKSSLDWIKDQNSQLTFSGRLENQNLKFKKSNQNPYSPHFFLWASEILYKKQKVHSQQQFKVFKGYSLGGVNDHSTLPQHLKSYDPEDLYGLETTLTQHFSHWLSGSFNFFYHYRENPILEKSTQANPQDPNDFTVIKANATATQSYGIESSLLFTINKHWSLQTSGSLISTEQSEPGKKRSLAYSPTAQHHIQINFSPSSSWSFYLKNYGNSGFYFSNNKSENNQKSSPYHLLDAGLTWKNKNWKIKAWGTNLTNTKYPIHGFYFGNEPPDWESKLYLQLGAPFQAGLSGTYQW